MPLFLLDRDGVVVVNNSDNIKTPKKLQLVANAGDALARLTRAGFDVVICTNQPEVARGAMTAAQLEVVHDALVSMLAAHGAKIDLVMCCTSLRKCPWRKPSAGMLREALKRYGAKAAETPFVGDQADDLSRFPCRMPARVGEDGFRAKDPAGRLARLLGAGGGAR
jgi:D-glycero-D-manno-heptose 1,7-bisphosphate phosphatase